MANGIDEAVSADGPFDSDALGRARRRASPLVPRNLRASFEATIGNLDLILRAGAAEAGWADSVARVGRRTIRRVWQAGGLLPLARSRGNDLHSGILRALPGTDADYGEALAAVRVAQAEIDVGTVAWGHLEAAADFLTAAVGIEAAYLSLAGLSFQAKRTAWKPVADRIRATAMPADRKREAIRKDFGHSSFGVGPPS